MTKQLTIEIHGTGTHNRGAELMASAVADRMRRAFPGVRLAVPPNFGDFESRARYGFLTTTDFSGRLFKRFFATLAPPTVRRVLGIIDPEEVDVVLDASGFAFSDQWGPQRAINLLKKMNSSKRRRQLLILLPQALGPFQNAEVCAASRALMDRAAMVCARDALSHCEAARLCSSSKLRKYPDFTVGISPKEVQDPILPAEFSAVVPNIHMVDMTASGEEYLDFLTYSIRGLNSRGLNPVFVLHDAREDRKVIHEVEKRGIQIPVIEHHDPRVLKGVLGRATLVIASRFHALVSALSLGVPCIGAGWSHKYPELFNDFDCRELLISDLKPRRELDLLLDSLSSRTGREIWESRIRSAGVGVKEQTLAMWSEIEFRIRTVNACESRNSTTPP